MINVSPTSDNGKLSIGLVFHILQSFQLPCMKR